MIIIGICGGTASGKSTLSQELIKYLNTKNIKSDYLFLTVDETVKFFLPLALLLLRSFLPPLVFILDLNPCFFNLLPFFG